MNKPILFKTDYKTFKKALMTPFGQIRSEKQFKEFIDSHKSENGENPTLLDVTNILITAIRNLTQAIKIEAIEKINCTEPQSQPKKPLGENPSQEDVVNVLVTAINNLAQTMQSFSRVTWEKE